jgi:hypothetical protein
MSEGNKKVFSDSRYQRTVAGFPEFLTLPVCACIRLPLVK